MQGIPASCNAKSVTHYVTQAAAGHEIVITRHGKALARLVPLEAKAVASTAEASARRTRIARALSVRAERSYPGRRFSRADAYGD